MCGRFALTISPDVVARRFGAPPRLGGGLPLGYTTELGDPGALPPPDAVVPRYNIAPTQTVITVTDDASRDLKQMRWG